MVGERLRTERERQNLSLRDIEKGTSIRAHYLEAIENGDFKALPGEVYAKGFVRNYATFLQMDANAAVKEFQADLQGAANAPEKGKNSKAKPKDEPKKTNLKKEEPAKEPPKPQEAQGQSKPEASTEAKQETPASMSVPESPTPAQAQEEKKEGHGAPFEAYQEEQADSSHKKRNAVVALVLLIVVICGAFFVLNNDASSEQGQPAKPVQPVQQTQPPQAQQQPQAQPAPAPAPAPQPPKPEGVELQLSFTDPCWTQVIVDGKNEFEGTVEGGKQLSFKGKDEIKLTGGNAGGVTITVNGQNQGPLGEAGQVVEKSFKAEKPAADAQQQAQPQPQQADAAANANAN